MNLEEKLNFKGKNMCIYYNELNVETSGEVDIVNITDDV